MASLLRAYKYANISLVTTTEPNLHSAVLLRRPYLASCTTAAVLFGTGDVIAQQAVEKRGKQHDVLGLSPLPPHLHLFCCIVRENSTARILWWYVSFAMRLAWLIRWKVSSSRRVQRRGIDS